MLGLLPSLLGTFLPQQRPSWTWTSRSPCWGLICWWWCAGGLQLRGICPRERWGILIFFPPLVVWSYGYGSENFPSWGRMIFHKKKWEWFVYSQIACLIWWASPWPANDWESKMLFGSILLRKQGHVLISGSKIWIQTHGLHLCATQRPLGPACWLPYGLERIPTSYVPRLWRLRSRGSTILLNGRRRLVRFGQKQQRAGKQRGRRVLIRCVITMTDLWRAR